MRESIKKYSRDIVNFFVKFLSSHLKVYCDLPVMQWSIHTRRMYIFIKQIQLTS